MSYLSLTQDFVDEIRAAGRQRRYSDGNGLYLLVKSDASGGGKYWVQRVTVDGTRRELGLGPARLVSLQEARNAAIANLRLVRAGGDPSALPRRAVGTPSFAEAVDTVIAMHAPTWKGKNGGRTAKQWRASLEEYACPHIGEMPVGSVTSADVMAVLLPIWVRKHVTAQRVRRRISTVMKWAIAQGLRTDDPAGDQVTAAMPKVDRERAHQRALPHAEVAGALAKIREADTRPAIRLVLEFIVLCVARSSEARMATWDEMDLATATWTIPAERMKSKRLHRVPLSDQAVAVLRQAASFGRRRRNFVFPSRVRRRPISGSTLVNALGDLHIDAVPHGFRSSFRDWAAELTDAPHAVMEAALAHTVHNQVEAAYARSDLLDRRRELMQDWADYVLPTLGAGAAKPSAASPEESMNRGTCAHGPPASVTGTGDGRNSPPHRPPDGHAAPVFDDRGERSPA